MSLFDRSVFEGRLNGVPNRPKPGADDEIFDHYSDSRYEKGQGVVRRALSAKFFQPHIPAAGTVIALGTSSALFLESLAAGRRVVVLPTSAKDKLRAIGCEISPASLEAFGQIHRGEADAVIINHFLEHLRSRSRVKAVILSAAAALRSGGRLIILQPNIRFYGPAYWDFIGHNLALTEEAVREAVIEAGFEIVFLAPRFLPDGVSAPAALARALCRPMLVSCYLNLPILWRIAGQQSLLVAAKKPAAATIEEQI